MYVPLKHLSRGFFFFFCCCLRASLPLAHGSGSGCAPRSGAGCANPNVGLSAGTLAPPKGQLASAGSGKGSSPGCSRGRGKGCGRGLGLGLGVGTVPGISNGVIPGRGRGSGIAAGDTRPGSPSGGAKGRGASMVTPGMSPNCAGPVLGTGNRVALGL